MWVGRVVATKLERANRNEAKPPSPSNMRLAHILKLYAVQCP